MSCRSKKERARASNLLFLWSNFVILTPSPPAPNAFYCMHIRANPTSKPPTTVCKMEAQLQWVHIAYTFLHVWCRRQFIKGLFLVGLVHGQFWLLFVRLLPLNSTSLSSHSTEFHSEGARNYCCSLVEKRTNSQCPLFSTSQLHQELFFLPPFTHCLSGGEQLNSFSTLCSF